MSEGFTSIVNEFRDRCRGLLAAFPDTAPEVVTDQEWGDYGAARLAFRLHGSHWSCASIFKNRSIIGFVNDDAYRFLLPRFICCALREDGIDADILDYVVFALKDKLANFSSAFSQSQRAALIPPLRFLHERIMADYSEPTTADGIARIIKKLEAIDNSP